MNPLLDKAMKAVARLPEAEQEAIARDILAQIEADDRWDRLLADPRSPGTLRRLAAEARADIARGDVIDGDPSTR